MILPTKGLGVERAMLTIGAEILELLTEPKTVSRLWDELTKTQVERCGDASSKVIKGGEPIST